MNESISSQNEESEGELPVWEHEMTERGESHRESVYQLPEDAAEDLGHPTSRKGWLEYWEDRLSEEIKEIPELYRATNNVRNQWIRDTAEANREKTTYLDERTRIMHTLASRLADIDARIDYPEGEQVGRRTVSYDTKKEELYTTSEDGAPHPFHLDNIATDIDWGLTYRPNTDIPQPLWRSIRKRMDIAEARKDIEEVSNREIAKIEGLSLPTTSIDGKWLEKHFNPHNRHIEGVIGERMAKNTLYALGRAHLGADFKIENSNALEDAELKYDFKIVLPDTVRGVATTPEDGVTREEYVTHKRSVGVQFTISNVPMNLDKKEGQLKTARERLQHEDMSTYIKRPVNDIVLVNLGLNASERYAQWLAEGKPSGGPEQYVSDEEKQLLLQKITAGLHF